MGIFTNLDFNLNLFSNLDRYFFDFYVCKIEDNMKEESPLSRTEATIAAAWLEGQGIAVPSGWISLWKMTPDAIAQEYKVGLVSLLKAIRR